MLTSEFFTRHPLACAIDLIGCELVWDRCRGLIVETEAYTALGDEACHTFLRRGAQRFLDEHPAGTAYIYLNYGVHWLLNVLVKSTASDGFVLIRALEPTAGVPLMIERRKLADPLKLCSGPGKLTQACGIPATFHGKSLCRSEQNAMHLPGSRERDSAVVCDVRVGISRAAHLPWRFLAAGSSHVSRKPGPQASEPLSRAEALARCAAAWDGAAHEPRMS